jgi:hypothetical protein
MPPQSVQAPPPAPHTPSWLPATHVPFWQQPAQLAGLQTGLAQAWLVQLSPCAEQLVHAAPLLPHTVPWVPVAQTPFWQQPVGQVPGPHGGVATQVPALQVELAPHALQAAPPLPHAASDVMSTQALPWQQPAQLAGLHVGVWQVPAPEQVWPFPAQLAHWLPARPHAVSSPPPTHTSPMQQPLQFAGPQAGMPTQMGVPPSEPLQVWPRMAQSSHMTPPMPQAVLLLPPCWQRLPTQQPSAQFCALHSEGVQVRVLVSQMSPNCVQSAHEAPLAPHCLASVPPTQNWVPVLSVTQQPNGQL